MTTTFRNLLRALPYILVFLLGSGSKQKTNNLDVAFFNGDIEGSIRLAAYEVWIGTSTEQKPGDGRMAAVGGLHQGPCGLKPTAAKMFVKVCVPTRAGWVGASLQEDLCRKFVAGHTSAVKQPVKFSEPQWFSICGIAIWHQHKQTESQRDAFHGV